MIIGTHTIIYSRDAEADRKFLKDHFGFPSIDVGEGWLIFGLPPSEIAVHPSSKNNKHEFFFLCTDIHEFVEEMKRAKVHCSPIKGQSWGYLTSVSLPGGGKVGVYQPLHKRPKAVSGAKRPNSKSGRKSTKK